ncbi:MAG: hypothetical protein AAFN74_25475 [Myxococcota bacterium]
MNVLPSLAQSAEVMQPAVSIAGSSGEKMTLHPELANTTKQMAVS